MHSPFFWRNLTVPLAVLVHLRWSLRNMRAHTAPAHPAHRTRLAAVLLRGGTLLYAMLSLIAALVAVLFFCTLEVFNAAQTRWQLSAQWPNVQQGMTPTQAVQLLGEPFQRPPSVHNGHREEQFVYPLHPLGASDEGLLNFVGDPTGVPTLSFKSPDDESWSRGRAEWIPQGYTRSRYRETAVEAAAIIAFGGLLLLGVLSLLPWRTTAGWHSWTLYTPVLALGLALIYELDQRGGWRFDLFLLLPVHAIILLAWGVRLRRFA